MTTKKPQPRQMDSDLTPAIVPIVDIDELIKEAYQEAYERPITLTADKGVHADSMPRVRAMAGNTDRGYGTYTESRTVAHKPFPDRHPEFVSRIETNHIVDDVARAMIHGTMDQYDGRDCNPERAF